MPQIICDGVGKRLAQRRLQEKCVEAAIRCQSVTSSVNKRATEPLAVVEILSGVEKLEASVY